MEPEEITYWQQQSAPLITTEAGTANVVNPRIFSVLQEVVHNWQNFLQQNGIERLLKSCNEVPGFELRLTRSRDQFAAYALFFDETPMPFSYPAPVAVQHLGLKDKLSEALLATPIEALFAATYPDNRDRGTGRRDPATADLNDQRPARRAPPMPHTDAWFTGFTPRLSRQRLGWLRRSPWPSK
jgi:hypothetical protein